MAEREGFEPSVRLRAQRFSRPPRSTTPAPLRGTERLAFRGGERNISVVMEWLNKMKESPLMAGGQPLSRILGRLSGERSARAFRGDERNGGRSANDGNARA